MPHYTYTGRTLVGNTVQGKRTATNHDELTAALLVEGVFVDEVRPTLTTTQTTFLQWFHKAEVTRVTRQIAILLDSHLDVSEVFDLAKEQVKSAALKTVLDDIRFQLESGRNVAAAFRDYPAIFDQSYTAMLEAGESAAQLAEAFDRIATYREAREDLIKTIRGALTYPALVLTVAILVVITLLVYVVPVFASMYANFGTELPQLTQLIVNTSEVLREHAATLLIGIVVLFVLMITLTRTSAIKKTASIVPLITPGLKRVYTKVVAARFARTMGAMLTAGVDIIYAITIASQVVDNHTITQRLTSASHATMSGTTLTQALQATNTFPRPLLRMCQSGEQSGQLGPMLLKAAHYYEKQTETDLTLLTTILEPAILLILGAIIAFLLIAMYLPMFDLIGTL